MKYNCIFITLFAFTTALFNGCCKKELLESSTTKLWYEQPAIYTENDKFFENHKDLVYIPVKLAIHSGSWEPLWINFFYPKSI